MNPQNSVNLIGRLTRDIELRYNQNQNAVARFTLAVDRMNKEKETDFISCVAFGKTAELFDRYTEKGSRVAITGSIRTGSYENRDRNKVYTTDVYVDSVSIIDFKDAGKKVSVKDKKADDFTEINDINDEELPF